MNVSNASQFDPVSPEGHAFVSARICENRLRQPQELTLAEFSEIATVKKLVNHGRKWDVIFNAQSSGFCDSPTRVDALREAHSMEVSNAIYSNSPDAPDFMEKAVFPPENVLAEYPELRVKFAEVFEAQELIQRTKKILCSVDHYIGEHSDWWDDQIDSAGSKSVKQELESWRANVMVPGEPENAAKCLSQFVRLVQDGNLDWLESSDAVSLENTLYADAKSVVQLGSKLSPVVREGVFSGMVLGVSEGVVTQKINRDGATVRHALGALSGPVVVGSVVDIAYANGVGVVGGKGVEAGVGR